MTKTATLVILTYDEAEALARLLPDVPLDMFDRVIAVDGGSTDGTIELFAERGIECLVQTKKGRGEAFLLARDVVDTDLVVFLSGDGNEDVGDLGKILEHLREGYDMVVAGRFLLPGSESDDSDDPTGIRRYGTILGSLFIRIVWRSGVRDAMNGYRGFDVRAMKRMGLDASFNDIELQSTIRSAKLGMRVKEFATRELPRLGGYRKPTAGTLFLIKTHTRRILRELLAGSRVDGGGHRH